MAGWLDGWCIESSRNPPASRTRRIMRQNPLQSADKVFGTAKAATDQKATVKHAKEQLGLIEPRAMFRREMKDMPVAWIAQKGPALRSLCELLGLKRHVAPASHQAADIQTPVGV